MEHKFLDIVRVNDSCMLRQIGLLRSSVWQNELPAMTPLSEDGVWLDEFDHYENTTQYVIMCESEIVAAARLSIHNRLVAMPYADEFSPYDLCLGNMYGYISRLVVHRNFRGMGMARRLDMIRLHDASEHGANVVIALALPYRVEPLSKIGFTYFGPSGVEVTQQRGIQVHSHVMAHYDTELPLMAMMETAKVKVM